MDICINVGKLELIKSDVLIIKKEKQTSFDIILNKMKIEVRLFEEENAKSPIYDVNDDGQSGTYSIYGINSGGIGMWNPMEIATINNKRIYLSFLVNRIGVNEDNLGYRFEYSLYREV